jgi:2-amino-4-hydroxy-6-hydroxymethyldihydropteridine diphosphokinase
MLECVLVRQERQPVSEPVLSWIDLSTMPATHAILLLLGGNEGDPIAALTKAELKIAERIGHILSRSRDHWTEPWGFEDPRLFLNKALIIESGLAPQQVMEECLEIERALGRDRKPGTPLGSRLIDIDILLINGITLSTDSLIVPHPRMHERRFALAPAADIAPEWVVPTEGKTVLFLLDSLGATAENRRNAV